MRRKLTTEEFIKRAQEIHKNEDGTPKYDYSLTEYTGIFNKVKIICPIHGHFEQIANSHINEGKGCAKCATYKNAKSRRYDLKDIIERCIKIHGDKYDYSEVVYVNYDTPIKIYCKKHEHYFYQDLNHHILRGQGCDICGNEKVLWMSKERISNTEEFIEKAKKVHEDRYIYDGVKYIKANLKVKIYCPKHQEYFYMTPNKHLAGEKCNKCSIEDAANILKMGKEEFTKRSVKIHKDQNGEPKYDYSLVDYTNNITKVKIICKKHNFIFEQSPAVHLKHGGCPICRQSKGEQMIMNVLVNNKIKFEMQYSFDECKNINKLPFDFYIPNLKTCIEFNGEQHYTPINYFGGIKNFKKQQKRDTVKKKYCEENNIKLIVIKFDQDVETRLIEEGVIKKKET